MPETGKLLSLEDLAATLERLRAAGKRVVHCHGVFDLLHIGHVRHFEQARKLGDVLVVTLTPDRFVNKGVGRPAFTETLRAEFLASLGLRRLRRDQPLADRGRDDPPAAARTCSPRGASSAD